jgi:hypothetical protein
LEIVHKEYPGISSANNAKLSFVVDSSAKGFSVSINGSNVYGLDIENESVPASHIPQGYVGGNDFGLFAAYKTHSCTQLSYAYMTDIGLYSEFVTGKTSAMVNIVDSTYPGSEEKPLLAAYTQEGYIGQTFTVALPEKIGKYVYLGGRVSDTDEAGDPISFDLDPEAQYFSGLYQKEGTAAPLVELRYANPTVVVEAVDAETHKVVKKDVHDGKDLATEYSFTPPEVKGYQVNSASAAPQVVTLTRQEPAKTLRFSYTSINDGHGVPRTGDSGAAMSAIVCVIGLAVAVGIVALSEVRRRHSRG